LATDFDIRGRIADHLQDFFELMVNCFYWVDYLDEDAYQDQETLRVFTREVYKEHVKNDADLCDFNLPEAQQAQRYRIIV